MLGGLEVMCPHCQHLRNLTALKAPSQVRPLSVALSLLRELGQQEHSLRRCHIKSRTEAPRDSCQLMPGHNHAEVRPLCLTPGLYLLGLKLQSVRHIRRCGASQKPVQIKIKIVACVRCLAGAQVGSSGDTGLRAEDLIACASRSKRHCEEITGSRRFRHESAAEADESLPLGR